MSTKAKTRPRSQTRRRQPRPVGKHLVVDPRVCHGKLTFEGTRVPVETILVRLAKGRSIASLRKSWPEVSEEAIGEAVSLATDLLVEHYENSNS